MIGILKEELFSGFMPLIDCFMFMDECQYNVNKVIIFLSQDKSIIEF